MASRVTYGSARTGPNVSSGLLLRDATIRYSYIIYIYKLHDKISLCSRLGLGGENCALVVAWYGRPRQPDLKYGKSRAIII
jgi:hypothetical protein